MRYLLLLYGDEVAEAALSRDERMKIVDDHIAFGRDLRDSGAWVSGEPLEASSAARTLRHDRTVTDGPFVEAREQLGGFYVVDCPDVEAALEVARRVPQGPGVTVEVRPIPGL